MRAAQTFALSNGLGIQDGLPAQMEHQAIQKVNRLKPAAKQQNQVNALRKRIDAAQSAGNYSLYSASVGG